MSSIAQVIAIINRLEEDGVMTFDLKRMTKSKSEFRHKLAELPLTEKLALLDELRERALAAGSLPQDIRHKTRARSQSGSDGEKRSKR